MEMLLHYVWKHKRFPLAPLMTDDGQMIEILDVGLPNRDAGPDFFNAKIKLDGVEWIGNIEIHIRASDWDGHHHAHDERYNNVILHVVHQLDAVAYTAEGKRLPQLALPIPTVVIDGFRVLEQQDHYPPCYEILQQWPMVKTHAWLNALTVERLEEKTERIQWHLQRTQGDWERVAFITLARNFGFSVNADVFEQWAYLIPPSAVGKHRDRAEQVEAFFLGQAGFLAEDVVAEAQQDDYFKMLQREYHFLRHKFGLRPLSARAWRFLRMRPQNFPTIRLVQLARLYHEGRFQLSKILNAANLDELCPLLQVGVSPYWETHYDFGRESASRHKTLQKGSIDLVFINTIIPLLFAYGRTHYQERLCEKAFDWLTQLPAERNHITKDWEMVGLKVNNAADSQALIKLKRAYCEPRKCIDCRLGTAYLQQCEHKNKE